MSWGLAKRRPGAWLASRITIGVKSMPDSKSEFCDQSFDGVARLFPLPGLVVYPHVVQALHLFEMRYREMLKAALAGDGLIAMGVLRPGFEEDYEGNPPVHPTVCLGKIISHTPLADGCSNILLLGIRRGRIIEELDTSDSFRTVRIEIIQDEYRTTGPGQRDRLVERLMAAYREKMPKPAMITEQIMQTLSDQLTLGILTDLIAYSIDLSIGRKLELLGEMDVDRRANCLLQCLSPSGTPPTSADGRCFPPGFSVN